MQRYDMINTPLGHIAIMENEKGVTYVGFDENAAKRHGAGRGTLQTGADKQLMDYLEGKLKVFELPLVLQGTSFQKTVYRALLRIPYGECRSYADIAKAICNPKAYRAVGQAIAKNMLCILVPCHRVLSSAGQLGGYHGEMWRKRQLLSLEGIPFKESKRNPKSV